MTPIEFLEGFETSKARPPSKFLSVLLSSRLLQNNPWSAEHLTTFPAPSSDYFHNLPQNSTVKFVTVIAYSLVPFSISFFFCHCDKNYDQKQLRFGGGFNLPVYRPSWRKIRAGIQGRGVPLEVGTEAAAMVDAAYWFAIHGLHRLPFLKDLFIHLFI